MSNFLNSIIQELDTTTEYYPYVDIIDKPDTVLNKVNRNLIQLPFIHANSIPVLWTFGRLNLAYGNDSVAADTFTQLNILHNNIQNPLIYQDSLASFTHNKRFTSFGLLNNDLSKQHYIRESDLAAFLLLDKNRLDLPNTLNVLEQIHQIRPGDLYTNYHLWKAAIANQDDVKASYYRNILEEFPLEAIHPDDTRLLEFVAQVIPYLLQDGVWSHQKTERIIEFLVWQHHDSSAVKRLLQKLQGTYPQQAEWSFYLAEYYDRSGDFALAEETYHHALEIDEDFSEVFFRLGSLYERKETDSLNSNKGEELTKALAYYETYYQQIPTDIIGLQQLVNVARELGMPLVDHEYDLLERLNGYQYLEDNFPDIFEALTIGENTIDASFFIEEDRFLHPDWTYHEYIGSNFDRGLFFEGIDDLYAYAPSYRIINFWQSDSDISIIPYAEIIGKPIDIPRGSYIVSIIYSWSHVENGISLLYLGADSGIADEVLLHGGIPITNDYWAVKHFLVNNQTHALTSEYMPIVRNWGQGDLHIHSLSMYQLQEDKK